MKLVLIAATTTLPFVHGAVHPKPPDSAESSARTRAEMRNVNYHYDHSLVIHIRYLRGALAPTRSGTPPTFDDKRSFSISIDSAEIAISSAALETLMNNYVFSDPASPIKDVKFSMSGSELKQTGTVHKGVDLPFEMKAEVSATPEGKIRLRPRSLKLLQVPVKGALHTFGLHLSDLVDPKHAPGVRVVKDDLILDPSQMLPPPKMHGRITSVRIEGDQMVQVFGKPAIAIENRNYMKFTGGIIRFGKLTMHDADLSLVDKTPGDRFEFSLDRYKDQLVAGYSKTTPSFGLEVYMPDVNELGRLARP